MTFKPLGRWLWRNGPALVTDCVGLGAVGLISYGAWMLSEAAGFIVGGSLLLVGVIRIGAARSAGNSNSESS